MKDNFSFQRSIQLLDSALQNQIAAGEVVERPASVLKELIENALDAGADEINVELEDGGLSLLRISDNGHGIRQDELELAVTRYATSKVQSFSELLQVNSYGFRGEALPSIASVARLRLSSIFKSFESLEQNNHVEAAFIEIEHGRLINQGITALNQGTIIEVRDLFANVPARLKFLKTPATELKRCQELFFRLALTRLDVAFSLTSGAKNLITCHKNESLTERLGHFWSGDLIEQLAEFKQDNNIFSISGLLANPEQAQSKKERVLFYVNKRPISDRILSAALREAYKGRLISREHPQAVIFLELPAEDLDVNVHPAKSEVRFRDERAIFSFVLSSLKNTLNEKFALTASPLARLENSPQSDINFASSLSKEGYKALSTPLELWGDLALEPDKMPVMGKQAFYERELAETLKTVVGIDSSVPYNPELNEDENIVQIPAWDKHIPSAPYSALRNQGLAETEFVQPVYTAEQIPCTQNAREAYLNQPPEIQGYEYLGQIEACYLLLKQKAQNGQGAVFILDQHAIHEVVLYHGFRQGAMRGQSQLLAFPLELKLSLDETEIYFNEQTQLKALGFGLEFVETENTLLVSGLPPNLKRNEALGFLKAVLAEESDNELKIWEMWACRAAIKAGDILTIDEALGLINLWLAVPNREFCPHGRPVVLRFGSEEFAKLFKRK
ncbi:DNA mismatch repair endonuclease MutL [Desulfovibrio litoralis]|uniref:DNA mismatch repair protein MutL n=1 Tax=Desulfovibrio litoralis DSM 11393 TaxID=1121455 RepID=A0A1M7TJ15_9BACT|nr:DNA mismatch repair endonuclease MutL [Desulfovibrio litoralis]SHN70701.1 DNA mismatch repair protein MutL [Desulfovibrio litoralis DSM 11393]